MEYPTWKNIVSWWQYQSSQYPFFVLGANFGPYHTEEYRSAMDKVYTKLKDICFRDSYSKRDGRIFFSIFVFVEFSSMIFKFFCFSKTF